ncbi:MAG: hypothetical protein ACKO38_18950 [Planctomycetota bacterium]
MRRLVCVGLVWLSAVATAVAAPMSSEELKMQQDAYRQWWGGELILKLADLPASGGVPAFRIPYSGHDYPDRAGGTAQAMARYDQAFSNGRPVLANWERQDTGGSSRNGGSGRRGLFGRFGGSRTPGWHGHCNGWTAASIRHAEPVYSVVRNGVTFTPADIKGLLAEIYMYSNSEFLGGLDPAINPAILHVVLTNWVGRGEHPLGLESALGEVVINYPLYKYTSRLTKLSDRRFEAQTTVTYRMTTPREYQKGPEYSRNMYFHYALDLNADGIITGGSYYGDSQQIDMLWAPLMAVQGGQVGNDRGNPHLNVTEVLSIWRDSVPEATRAKWLNINPTSEDAIETPEEPATEATPAAEAKPAEAKPAEAKPTPDAKPAEAKPVVEAKPAEAKPADAPAKPEAKPESAAEAKPESTN